MRSVNCLIKLYPERLQLIAPAPGQIWLKVQARHDGFAAAPCALQALVRAADGTWPAVLAGGVSHFTRKPVDVTLSSDVPRRRADGRCPLAARADSNSGCGCQQARAIDAIADLGTDLIAAIFKAECANDLGNAG